MDLTTLKNIGLSDQEISIYSVLLLDGELPANDIIKKTGIKKGDCYNKIYDLKERGFIEEFNKEKKKHFRLAHPEKIKEYIDAKMHAISQTEREIDAILPSIISTFNLTYHKPGVQYFEGEEGLKMVMEDTLKSTSEILSYIDIETFDSQYLELNKKYLKKRYESQINKKNLIPETDYSNKYTSQNNTIYSQFRTIRPCPDLKGISMNIYGNKVSFQTFKKDALISIIIEDPIITNFLRALYQLLWDQAKEI